MTAEPLDLAALRTLAEAATPGPWDTYLNFQVVQASVPNEDVIDDETWFSADLYGPRASTDAALIVAAVNALPALISEVESLRARNDALAAAVAEGDRRIETLRESIHPTIDGYCPACSGGCLIGFATPTPARAALAATEPTEREAGL